MCCSASPFVSFFSPRHPMPCFDPTGNRGSRSSSPGEGDAPSREMSVLSLLIMIRRMQTCSAEQTVSHTIPSGSLNTRPCQLPPSLQLAKCGLSGEGMGPFIHEFPSHWHIFVRRAHYSHIFLPNRYHYGVPLAMILVTDMQPPICDLLSHA